MKTCSKCGETKSLMEFPKNKRRSDGLQSWCRACDRAYHKTYYKAHLNEQRVKNKSYRDAHREQEIERTKTYREANRAAIRARTKARRDANRELCRRKERSRHLQRKFGITADRYESMLSEQKGRCAICRTDMTDAEEAFHVDHDHESKLVRGLLCRKCNTALGMLDDSPEILRRAMLYVIAGGGAQ